VGRPAPRFSTGLSTLPDSLARRSAHDGWSVSLFIVDRILPGLTVQQLGIAQHAMVESARRLGGNGERVRYIRSTLIPSQSRCLCLFEADHRNLVRTVNETAQFPFSRIDEAVELVTP
jgi:hypothetical protein